MSYVSIEVSVKDFEVIPLNLQSLEYTARDFWENGEICWSTKINKFLLIVRNIPMEAQFFIWIYLTTPL